MKYPTLVPFVLFYSLAATAQQARESAPVPVLTPEPEYSERARAAKVQGSCLLSLVVDTDGRTGDIQVVRSLEPTLDEKAIEAVKKWTFRPAEQGGVPIVAHIIVRVDFHMDPLLSSEILKDETGDLGIKSDMIAYSHEALGVLKQKGDRNYYEISLDGAQPLSVSNVILHLKGSDPKHGKVSLSVIADHKTMQKRNRSIREPIQFYCSGSLYELVIWSVGKDNATGYLSTPKNKQ